MGVSIGVTMIQVQITSLAPELTTDYDERTVVSAYRLVAVIAGGLVCVLGHAGILSIFDDVALGYRVSGCVFATVILIVVWTVFCGIKERFVEGQEGDDTFNRWQELKTMFENKAFLNVIIIYICGPTAVFLVQTNLLLYCKYAIGDESLLNFIMIAVQGTAFLSAPFWVWIGQRFGKRSLYFFGGPVLITAFASLYVANDAVLVGMIGICVGSCLAVAYLAPYSMLPDVLELDELRTGKRREGLYGGFFTISMKISTTIAITMTNVALKLAGYKSPQTTCNVDAIDTGLPDSQPDSVVAMIRALISLFPAFLILLAMFFSWSFPITKGNHSQTVEMVKHLREDNIRRHSKMSCVEERDELEDPKDPRQAITCTTAPPLAEGPQFDSEGFRIGDRVEFHHPALKLWQEGTVRSLVPFKVQPDGWTVPYEFDEVRRKQANTPTLDDVTEAIHRRKQVELLFKGKPKLAELLAECDQDIADAKANRTAAKAAPQLPRKVDREDAKAFLRLEGKCWNLPMTLELKQEDSDAVSGKGTNQNGHFPISGSGQLRNCLELVATPTTGGEFRIQISWHGEDQRYYGKTLEQGNEGKECHFDVQQAEDERRYLEAERKASKQDAQREMLALDDKQAWDAVAQPPQEPEPAEKHVDLPNSMSDAPFIE
jgi:GPH family glycoside/pentoside/hexuronide:cation symporter